MSILNTSSCSSVLNAGMPLVLFCSAFRSAFVDWPRNPASLRAFVVHAGSVEPPHRSGHCQPSGTSSHRPAFAISVLLECSWADPGLLWPLVQEDWTICGGHRVGSGAHETCDCKPDCRLYKLQDLLGKSRDDKTLKPLLRTATGNCYYP